MKKYLLLTILIPTLMSCKYINFSSDKVVAEVGGQKLLESDVRELIPEGTNPEDSIRMLEQYINNWATKHLLLKKAESELSKSEKDVEQELEDYRNSLLVYRYENLFIESRLDTTITDEECREYYAKHSSNFTSNSSVVKARVIKISQNSPNIAAIKNLFKANGIEEIDELERLCYNSADKYDNFGNNWVDISAVASMIPYDVQSCERAASNSSYIETSDTLYNYFVYFLDKIAPGEIPPFEYYLPRIKEIILIKRKQELISELEKSLLKEALENNTLKTNINK
ncbi:MAG: peptidylprolyl isomerase [Rikenellaceae bacterium]|nr:peptidylprolyl isomerase [Rikenellaceae bacterium]